MWKRQREPFLFPNNKRFFLLLNILPLSYHPFLLLLRPSFRNNRCKIQIENPLIILYPLWCYACAKLLSVVRWMLTWSCAVKCSFCFAARFVFQKLVGSISSANSFLEPVAIIEKGLLPAEYIMEDPDSHFIYILYKYWQTNWFKVTSLHSLDSVEKTRGL